MQELLGEDFYLEEPVLAFFENKFSHRLHQLTFSLLVSLVQNETELETTLDGIDLLESRVLRHWILEKQSHLGKSCPRPEPVKGQASKKRIVDESAKKVKAPSRWVETPGGVVLARRLAFVLFFHTGSRSLSNSQKQEAMNKVYDEIPWENRILDWKVCLGQRREATRELRRAYSSLEYDDEQAKLFYKTKFQETKAEIEKFLSTE